MRFFLVDRITKLVPGKQATAIKCWSLDNVIFRDHFPGFPTTPGVLLTESMAQLAGILIEKSYYKEYGESQKVYPVLSIIQKAKFKKFVRPGDQCFLYADVTCVDKGRGTAKVKTMVGEEEVCSAILSFVIALESDMEKNPFLGKKDEYLHNIMPKS